MIVLLIIYVIANIFALFYIAENTDLDEGFQNKHLIFAIVFLPALLIFLVTIAIVLIFFRIEEIFNKEPIKKFLNKKLF